jgi:hypothetical protein
MDIGIVAPHWVQQALWVGLLMSSLSYLVRLFIPPAIMRKIYAKYNPATGEQIESGYSDWDNEFGHFWCIYATCQALGPVALQAPTKLWVITLSIGTIFFCVRGLTWGPKRPKNKWWWDPLHAGMFLSMDLMYTQLGLHMGIWLWSLDLLFWIGMVSFYAYLIYECYTELKDPGFTWLYHLLSIVEVLSHEMMGISMLTMVAFPLVLMGAYNAMPGMICYGH